MRSGRLIRLLSLVVSLCLFSAIASAQSFRGSIRGTVTDPSGGVLPNAKVTAKNIATGLVRETVTSGDGAYVIAELPAGEYTVTAQAAQLQPAAQNVQVNVGLDTTANFDLTSVQKVNEQVLVSAEDVPIVETTRDVLGEVVERRLVNELPLNGRDFGKLVALVPGTTVDPSGVAGTEDGFGQFNINGNRDRSNNYALDGTDNNDPFFNNSALNQTGIGGAPASLLPIDAIQEFNLESQFSAEYGRNSGSVVNIVTRSGSNKLHGSGYEFFRNSGLDARNYFNTESRKSVFQNNNFGASLGGPIIKDKTFFFGAYEGQRENVGSDFLLLVPTQAEIAEARSIAQGINPGGVINPGLDAILSFYPQSNVNQIASVVQDTNNGDYFLVKIDHSLTNSELLTGRYAFARNYQVFPFGSPGGYGTGSRLPAFAQTSPTRVQVLSLSLLSSLSGSHINEIRFGYSRYTTSFSSLNANWNPSDYGLNFGTGKLGLPEFDFTNIENLGAIGYSVPRGRTSQSFQILDNFTWITGKHTLKFGGEFRHAAISNFNDNLERGILQFTAGVGLSTDPIVDALANFYTGGTQDTTFCCTSVSVDTGNTHRDTFNNGFSFFAQDDYRLAPKFTLNFGLRWEYFGPLSEANNLLSNYNPVDGTLDMIGTDGLSNSLYNRDLHDFGPRIGFAWNPRSNLVIRGGYGIYYDYIPQDIFIANYTTSAGVATNPVGPQPVLPMNFNAQAFIGADTVDPIMSVATSGPYNIFAVPQNFGTPYIQNFNFNAQQQLASNASLEIGYVGSKGTRLVRLTDLNEFGQNPNFYQIDELGPFSFSNYNSLQATLRMENSHRFSGFATYNFSKSLDDASDGIDFAPGAAFPQDPSNLRAEHGPSTFDTKHRFTGAMNYDVRPFRSLGKFGSGWQLNWIASLQSGRPIPIDTSTDTFIPYNAYYNQRPSVIPGVNPIIHNWSPSTGYLNLNAFVQPAAPSATLPYGTPGDLGRNSIYGPGYKNLDFSITKNTPIREGLNFQLRAEFFNILNHPNFAQPNHVIVPGFVDEGAPTGIVPNPETPSGGELTQTPDVAQTNPGLGGGGPRVIQLALKILF
jgi:Carboxypeptidase regulatory-like domain/TonB dependent receptor/TonB-dependent Receptor Plug Domain